MTGTDEKNLTDEQRMFLAEHDENVRLHFENEELKEEIARLKEELRKVRK